MKPIWRKQPKKYNLRWAQKPNIKESLSGVLLVYNMTDSFVGYINIRFEPSFVSAIGKHMPFGIGVDNAAFLVLRVLDNKYEVWCQYLNSPATKILLWSQTEKPTWYRGVKNANTKKGECNGLISKK